NQGRPMSWRPCGTFLFSLREAPSSNEIASGRCLFRPDRMQSGMCGSFCAVRWCKALFRDGHHMANAVLALISHASDPSPIVGRRAENDPADFETDPANGWPRSAGFLRATLLTDVWRQLAPAGCEGQSTISTSDGVNPALHGLRSPPVSVGVCGRAEGVEGDQP